MARRATVIQRERDRGGIVLVLDAGDSLTGDRDPAKRTQGKSSIEAMNLMGYDAMALGPQDLTLGMDVLRQRISEAEFAVLSANAVVSATGRLLAAPYILRPFDDHQIAIIGLTGGQGTPEIALRDPLETVRSVVDEVAAEADVIILLSHAGAPMDQQITDKVPGIDLIVSGGTFQSETPWQSPQTGMLILHADEASPGHAGRRIGIAELKLDAMGALVNHEWRRLTLGPELAEDPEMATWTQLQLVP